MNNAKIKTAYDFIKDNVAQSSQDAVIEKVTNLINNPNYYDNDENFWVLFNRAIQGTVKRGILYKGDQGQDENILVILKYENAVVDSHYHQGEERILVLNGYQESFDHKNYQTIQPDLFAKINDDILRYDFNDGVVVNKVGTSHGVRSDDCLVLIFYDKLPKFAD